MSLSCNLFFLESWGKDTKIRFHRLRKAFDDLLLEIHLELYFATLPFFTSCNLFYKGTSYMIIFNRLPYKGMPYIIIFCRLTACKSKIKQHEQCFFSGCDPRTPKYAFRIKEMAFVAHRLSVACSYRKFLVRGASKTTAKSKMESFITKFDGQKPIIFVPEIFIIDWQ